MTCKGSAQPARGVVRVGSKRAFVSSLVAASATAMLFWMSAPSRVHGQDPPQVKGDAPPDGVKGPESGFKGKGGKGGGGGKGKAPAPPAGPVRRLANGKPDIQGYWNAGGGGLFSIEATDARKQIGVGAGKGIITDPPDG